MAKLLALFILLLLPLATAEAGWEDVLNPEGYVDTALEGIGLNQTSEDFVGGGGNPISGISDPIIAVINDSLGTNWGFIIFYTIVMLIMSIFLLPLVGGLILSYIAYFIGAATDFPYTFILMVVAFILGAFLFYKGTRKNEKLNGMRRILMLILVVFVIGVILLFAANVIGIQIPGFNII